MRKGPGFTRLRSALAAMVLLLTTSLALAACGGGNGSSTSTGTAAGTAASTGAGTGASTTASTGASTTAGTGGGSKCGAGNGQKASGAPVKIGSINTKQPGTDFTDIPTMAKAYFDCVNDNGGINGRPVKLLHRDRADQPGPDRGRRQAARADG